MTDPFDVKKARELATALTHSDGELHENNRGCRKALLSALDVIERQRGALHVAREQVLAVCEWNERLNNGEPSKEDRADLAQIDTALALTQETDDAPV